MLNGYPLTLKWHLTFDGMATLGTAPTLEVGLTQSATKGTLTTGPLVKGGISDFATPASIGPHLFSGLAANGANGQQVDMTASLVTNFGPQIITTAGGGGIGPDCSR